MQRDNVLIGIGVGIVVLILVSGVGYAVWKNNRETTNQNLQTNSSETSEGDTSSILSIYKQGGVALGSSADSSLQTNLGQQKAANGTGGSSSGSGTASFSEYDKYKDANNALIGEFTVGTGETAEGNKNAAILYKGWLTNGQLFDESKPEKTGERVQPLTFTFGGKNVIAGLEQGVYGMKVGGKRRIIVPPKVGYGERGYGPIPPNAVLVFDVELVAVQQ